VPTKDGRKEKSKSKKEKKNKKRKHRETVNEDELQLIEAEIKALQKSLA